MSRLFSFILLLVVFTIGIGFYRGWFSMSTNKQPSGEKLDVHFQVDRDKMKQDANSIEQKTKSLWENDKNATQTP
jgi:hypothetical protein